LQVIGSRQEQQPVGGTEEGQEDASGKGRKSGLLYARTNPIALSGLPGCDFKKVRRIKGSELMKATCLRYKPRKIAAVHPVHQKTKCLGIIRASLIAGTGKSYCGNPVNIVIVITMLIFSNMLCYGFVEVFKFGLTDLP
jgi:hypothetical protein